VFCFFGMQASYKLCADASQRIHSKYTIPGNKGSSMKPWNLWKCIWIAYKFCPLHLKEYSVKIYDAWALETRFFYETLNHLEVHLNSVTGSVWCITLKTLWNCIQWNSIFCLFVVKAFTLWVKRPVAIDTVMLSLMLLLLFFFTEVVSLPIRVNK
jgi:hypothetical protein